MRMVVAAVETVDHGCGGYDSGRDVGGRGGLGGGDGRGYGGGGFSGD